MAVFEIAELQLDYMYGIPIKDSRGCSLPEGVYQRYIDKAIAQLEHELDMTFKPVLHEEERHEYWRPDWRQWGHLDLHNKPIIDVTEVKAVWSAGAGEIVFPEEWYVYTPYLGDKSPISSTVELRPVEGTFARLLTHGGNLLPIFPSAGGWHRAPGIFKVTYRSGWPDDRELPADVRHLIGMMAAIGLLNLAGDLTLGVGIASKSISIPGLSKSTNTTQSATNAAFGARIGEYQKEVKELLPLLRDRFGQSTKMSVI